MDSTTLRRRYLDFFERERHALIGYAPLIPEHDPSVLFTTAGMHPLVPFLLGERHPAGRRLANYQKCLRTNDIDEVGDATHLTCFEMLGNWSLGDYWKQEALELNYRWLTEALGYDPERLHVTCFAGDADAPRDEESAQIWRELGIDQQRISFLPKQHNWWGPAGLTGPCGPDSEVFFDASPGGPPDETPATNHGRFWELCNNVFMAYEKLPDGRYVPLAQRNVDVGVGLERNLMVLQGAGSIFETDLFVPIVEAIARAARRPEQFSLRVIADHARAATMLLAEGLAPGNSDQPYIVRRLIRRAIRHCHKLGVEQPLLPTLAEQVVATLGAAYPELVARREHICAALEQEEALFLHALARGEREVQRHLGAASRRGQTQIDGKRAFDLYSTHGFPLELIEELAREWGLAVDRAGFERAFAQHQRKSREGAEQRFQGGLAERNPATTRLHTATHLLQAALRQLLGSHVEQRGSNITSERLRFDFAHPEPLTPDQLAEVETLVNQQIARDLPVSWRELSLAEAQAQGALGLFEERYSEVVKLYAIGDFSLEVCGGPHVASTGELGRLRILKQEPVSAGVRRIKAVLEEPSTKSHPRMPCGHNE